MGQQASNETLTQIRHEKIDLEKKLQAKHKELVDQRYQFSDQIKQLTEHNESLRRQLESVGRQLKVANDELADLEGVRSQSVSPDVTKLDQENQNLLELLQQSSLENESLLKKLQQTRAELEEVRSVKTDAVNFQFPDLTKIRDRTLAELKLGKQAPGYKSAQKALDSFIKQLEVGQ